MVVVPGHPSRGWGQALGCWWCSCVGRSGGAIVGGTVAWEPTACYSAATCEGTRGECIAPTGWRWGLVGPQEPLNLVA